MKDEQRSRLCTHYPIKVIYFYRSVTENREKNIYNRFSIDEAYTEIKFDRYLVCIKPTAFGIKSLTDMRISIIINAFILHTDKREKQR
jgi:hypothetical protein